MTKRRILVLTDVILTIGSICFLEISRLHSVSLEMENKKPQQKLRFYITYNLKKGLSYDINNLTRNNNHLFRCASVKLLYGTLVS